MTQEKTTIVVLASKPLIPNVLVAGFKIQPMVATLILYTAGRSIAAWINNNELPVISDPSFGYFGGVLFRFLHSVQTDVTDSWRYRR